MIATNEPNGLINACTVTDVSSSTAPTAVTVYNTHADDFNTSNIGSINPDVYAFMQRVNAIIEVRPDMLGNINHWIDKEIQAFDNATRFKANRRLREKWTRIGKRHGAKADHAEGQLYDMADRSGP